MTGRIVERLRGRVVDLDGSTFTDLNGRDWADVLIARRLDDTGIHVEVWGRASQHPAADAHPNDPQYVALGTFPDGDIAAMPHKGQQRQLTLGAESDPLTVHVLKNCCSSPYRDFRP